MNSLTDYSTDDAPMAMEIRSDTLEPISSSSKRFVFRLDQSGYLDQNSLLLFKIQNSTNTQQKRVNCFNGALGSIKRATFAVGDFVINDCDGADKIMTLLNFVGKNSQLRNNFDSWYYQNQLHFKVQTGTSTEETDNDLAGAGCIVIDPAKSGMGGAIDFQNGVTNALGATVNSVPITNVANDNAQMGIPLGVLFPALKGRTLPLFLFQDYRILITIEFNDGSKYINDVGNNNGRCAVGATTITDVKLQVDYIIMPSEVQNKDREMTAKQGGLNLTFYDSIKIEKNIPATPANVLQVVEHRIGADNKEVHKIYMTKMLTADSAGVGAKYTTYWTEQRIDAINQEEYNVNIGGVDLFPENKWAPSSQYDETSNCLGSDLQVPRPVYYADENTATNGLGSGINGTLGRYKPLCVDLTNGSDGILGTGRTIGAYPIIFKYARKPIAATDTIYKTGKEGALSVDYHLLVSKTANIKSTPNGTAVQVSY